MPEKPIGLLERDPREVGLPDWAQSLLHRYRLALQVIEAVHRHIVRPEGAVITISGVEPGMEQGSFFGEIKAEPMDPEPTEEDLKTLMAWHKHTLKRDGLDYRYENEESLDAPEPFPHYNEHEDSAYQAGKDRDDR